jgi:hypothetical protein
MAAPPTQGTNLAVADETTLGTLATSGWFNLQPNSYGDVGSSIKKIPRQPISKNRQRQKPIVVDLDSGVPFQADCTKDLLDKFLQGIFNAAVKHSGGTGLSLFRPTAVVDGGASPDEFTVAASGALQASTLIFTRGFTNAANNGLKNVVATSTATAIKVATGTLVAEASAPANATLDVVGYQGASGEIGLDASGNLTGSGATNFTTMGLSPGQWIWIGGALGGAFVFANTAYRGFARIKTITATLLTLERRTWVVGAADTGAGKTIQIFFSRWCRNVAIDHADHLKTSYSFEITYPDLGGVGVKKYEQPVGNLMDEWVWNLSLTDKSVVDLAFIGTNTPDPTATQATGASTALNPQTQVAVSTATDLPRMRIEKTDESGRFTDFKSLKVTFKNNVTPEKQLGTLGASIMQLGDFEVELEADVIFTSSDVIERIRDNATVQFDVAMRNGDFGALVDIMSMSIDEGDRNFQTNMSVTIKSKCTGFQDAVLGSTAGVSVFGYLPNP